MSDPLSVTAAILAVVTVGFQVAKGLHQLADGIGSVGMEARIYAEEIDSFSKLLQRIKEQLLQQPEQFSSFELNLLQDIVDVCKRVLHPINRIQAKLNPLLTKFRSSQSWLRSFGLRIQWMFSAKEKLLFYRGALRGQHRLLDTTLELMILKATKDRSPQNIHILQISIENSMAGLRNALNDSRGFITRNGEPFTAENSSTSSIPTGNSNTDRKRIESAQRHIVEAQERSTSFEPALPALETSTALDDEEAQVERELEDEFEESAHDLWEDMRVVSRKVLRHASNVLRSSQEETAQTTSRPQDQTRSETENIPTATSPPPDNLIPPSTSTAASSATPRSAGPVATLGTAHNITFINADGQSYALPLDEIFNWEDMNRFLRSLYPEPKKIHNEAWEYYDTMDPYQNRLKAFKCGSFRLFGPQNQRLEPRFWHKIIEPGWTIELRFVHDKLNVSERSQTEFEKKKRQLELSKAWFELQKQEIDLSRKAQRMTAEHETKRFKEWDDSRQNEEKFALRTTMEHPSLYIQHTTNDRNIPAARYQYPTVITDSKWSGLRKALSRMSKRTPGRKSKSSRSTIEPFELSSGYWVSQEGLPVDLPVEDLPVEDLSVVDVNLEDLSVEDLTVEDLRVKDQRQRAATA